MAYPTAKQAFLLEIGASKVGLGAALSQTQMNDKEHPFAYTSQALSQQETHYTITGLEPWLWCYFCGHYIEVMMTTLL